jgi:hypothetical protein
MICTGITIAFTILGALCFIIGIPIFLSGCNDQQTICINYNVYSANVISNNCIEYHGKNDDRIAYNCNVIVEYFLKNQPQTCSIYRSDSDNCDPPVSNWYYYYHCKNLNNMDYPIGSYHDIYVKNNRCYSHHYVTHLSHIGFGFLMTSVVLIGLLTISLLYNYYKLDMNNYISFNTYTALPSSTHGNMVL